MKRFVLNSTVAAIALLTSGGAFAADYNSGVVSKSPGGGFTDVEFGSGWYLRGDISFNLEGKSSGGAQTIDALAPSAELITDYDDVLGFRVGAGYYVSPHFRIEATAETLLDSQFEGVFNRGFSGSREDAVGGLDYFDSNGQVTASTDPTFVGSYVTPINGTEQVDAEYHATNFMLNGYYDLNSFGNFTPYVGAGIGVSRISTSEVRTYNCIPGASVETCVFPAGAAGEATSAVRTRDDAYYAFAYSLSVGAAVSISENTKLDFGYSYSSIDGGDDLSYSDGSAISEDGFAIHQVRAGIRYDIW
jgi:opacity protein-like surface antigen